MKWNETKRSGNVTNRGGMGMGTIGGGAGIIIALIAMVLGINPGDILNQGGDPNAPQQSGPMSQSDSMGTEFVRHILGDTEVTWGEIFQTMGKTYEEPKLDIFSGQIQSACGLASSAVGPFYCSSDHKVYIDLAFYEDLRTKLGADGDFAQAYVIAHEVGHHVQNLLGLADQVADARQGASNTAANKLSVRMELQADCFAGVWAFNADTKRHVIQPGDIDEALNAASAIGDDKLQQEAQGRVVPESFTHGTSAQRSAWFHRGYAAGDFRQCDTFGATQL